MRILTSRYKRIDSLAYSADGGVLYGCGGLPESKPRRKTFGVDYWIPHDSTGPEGIFHAGQCVRGIQTLLNGQLLVAAYDRTPNYYPELYFYESPVAESQALRVRCEPTCPFAVAPDGGRFVVGVRDGNISREEWRAFQVMSGWPTIPDWTCAPRAPCENAEAALWSNVIALSVAFDTVGERCLTTEQHWRTQVIRVTRLRDANDGSPLSPPIILPASATSAILADGDARIIVVAGSSLYGYEVAHPSAKPVKCYSGNRKHFTGIAVHPDGRRVLATCNDETVREYDAVTLQELRAYAWQVGRLRCVAVAPDGLTAAAGSDTGKVVVWDLE